MNNRQGYNSYKIYKKDYIKLQNYHRGGMGFYNTT